MCKFTVKTNNQSITIMKTLKKLFVAAMALLVTSCSDTFIYQVYDVKSDLSQVQKSLVYENSDCTFTYDLWEKGGSLGFLATNKTEKDMFIVLPQSFFIRNGIAYDYYAAGSDSYTIAGVISSSESANAAVGGYLERYGKWYPVALNYSVGKSATAAVSKTRTVADPKIICIPARSTKYVAGFIISDYIYKDCDHPEQNYPKKQSSTISYTKDNSPLVFRNRIAYTFELEGSNYKYVDNEFYVSSLTNYSQKVALEKTKEPVCESSLKVKSKRFTVSAPNRFYNKFRKQLQSVGTATQKK